MPARRITHIVFPILSPVPRCTRKCGLPGLTVQVYTEIHIWSLNLILNQKTIKKHREQFETAQKKTNKDTTTINLHLVKPSYSAGNPPQDSTGSFKHPGKPAIKKSTGYVRLSTGRNETDSSGVSSSLAGTIPDSPVMFESVNAKRIVWVSVQLIDWWSQRESGGSRMKQGCVPFPIFRKCIKDGQICILGILFVSSDIVQLLSSPNLHCASEGDDNVVGMSVPWGPSHDLSQIKPFERSSWMDWSGTHQNQSDTFHLSRQCRIYVKNDIRTSIYIYSMYIVK